MMKRIVVKNFRCFGKKQEVRMAPLTLLVGENSTGKTSFLALNRILWDVAFEEVIPNFKKEPYDLGSYDEIAHYRGGRSGRADSFEAGFDIIPPEWVESKEDFCFRVTFQRSGTAPFPVRRRLDRKAIWIEEQVDKQRILFGSRKGRKGSVKNPFPYGQGDESLAPFHFLSVALAVEDYPPKSRATAKQITEEESGEVLSLARDFRMTSGRRLYASAPVRSKPRRTYDPARPTGDPEGEYIPMYLADMHFHGGDEWKKLKKELQNFGKNSGLFDEISVRPLGKKETEPFQLQIRRFEGGLKGPRHNLIDVGYGVSQVLPVVTELLRPDAPDVCLLQQPEVHLHPSAQAALGSLFCRIAETGRQLIVETHSDYMLDRVRMDIRDGKSKLNPEDVSILYFERKDLDVKIHSIGLDKEGNVLNAPSSYRKFFMEEVNRRLKL